MDESGIRWRVIVVSACHSGSFIDELKTPYTMVITASHTDRSSFGCSNDSEYTYFGRAFFINALQNSQGFEESFFNAKKEIRLREAKMGFRPSRPQIFVGNKIKTKLINVEQKLFNSVEQTVVTE